MLKYAIFMTDKPYTNAFDYNVEVTLRRHIKQVINEMATPDCFALYGSLKDAVKEAKRLSHNHECVVINLNNGIKMF